jgi:undecaprenyl pyrophosphate phosphatase UppP
MGGSRRVVQKDKKGQNMNMILTLKIICWFVSILFTITNLARMVAKQNIPPANIIYHAMGITGLIILYFEIGG